MTYPPTLPEAIELIKKMIADLKRVPFDSREQERRDHITDAEDFCWRYNNCQNGGAKCS